MRTAPRRTSGAFTLIELLCVIAIIAILASLLVPVIGRVIDNANTTRCIGNLKQIGVAVHAYATDHDNTLPLVETDPKNPVYEADAGAKPLIEVLKPYNLPPEVFRCPADVKARLDFPANSPSGTSYYEDRGSSYEWRPMFDEEMITSAKIYTPRGAFPVPQSRVRLLVDYVNAGECPHNRDPVSSSYNNLYADGSVRTLTIRKVDPNKTW